MFPATMPWPMTLAPMKEAVRRESHAEISLIRKKINRHDPRGHEIVRMVLLSKKRKIL